MCACCLHCVEAGLVSHMVGLDAPIVGCFVESSCFVVHHALWIKWHAVLTILLHVGRLCALCISVRQLCTVVHERCVMHDCRARL